MFTARSEFRLSLRTDNADLRLTEKGRQAGCVGDERYEKFASFKRRYDQSIEYLSSWVQSVTQWRQQAPVLPVFKETPQKKSAIDLLRVDGVCLSAFDDVAEPRYRQLWQGDEQLMERIRIHSLYVNDELKQSDEISTSTKSQSQTNRRRSCAHIDRAPWELPHAYQA